MMKRIFTLFLIAVLTVSLAACGGSGATDTSGTEGGNPSSGVTDTAGGDTGSTDTDEVKSVVYDPEMEHKIIVADDGNHRVVVYDLNAGGEDFQDLTDESKSVVWEWDMDEDPNTEYKSHGAGLSSAKHRYSPYYKKDVVIACSSTGWCGIIDYEERCVLWEYNAYRGPHSVEMLPNGDLVVAVSTEDASRLIYFPVSCGMTQPSHEVEILYAHGVSWDPERECLWVLEYNGVCCVNISNMGTENAKFVQIAGVGDTFKTSSKGGHAFSPVGGEPGKYWASNNGSLVVFDAEEETLSFNYRHRDLLDSAGIKGICSFADGTVVRVYWDSTLHILTRREVQGKVSSVKATETEVSFPTGRFYKVQPFTKDYQ